MKYYPAFLDLTGKNVVVIGGGKVAERKVRTLVSAGACVRVISPEITVGLERLKAKGEFEHIQRSYKKGDLNNAFLVIAATSSGETNSRIAREAKYLVNVINSPSEGNFIVPSSIKRGPLTIAISTGGASPAVSRAIRKEMEDRYDREFAKYLRFAETIRKQAMKEIPDDKRRELFFRSIADEEIFRLLRSKGFDAASEHIKQAMKKIK